MKKLHVKATFIEPVLGTWPANPNVAREFIARMLQPSRMKWRLLALMR